jgi:hypothetical protein
MEQIRTLTKDEIECRVSLIKDYTKNGKDAAFCQLLLYKDARVDQRLLDEIYGSLNWKREHQLIGDRLYCTVSIWDAEKKEWVSKQDVGTESYTEKEKGQASDSFKRACFNWGIGRELYSAPQITIFLEDNEWKANQKGSLVLNRISFEVSRLEHDEQGNIIYLEIKDDKGRIRFPSKPKEESAPAPAPYLRSALPGARPDPPPGGSCHPVHWSKDGKLPPAGSGGKGRKYLPQEDLFAEKATAPVPPARLQSQPESREHNYRRSPA